MTNFYNIWHMVHLLTYPPHLRTAATLPWETLVVVLGLVKKV